MALIVSCPNGHKLRVQDEHAGKKVRCPTCKSVIPVPARRASQPSDDDLYSDLMGSDPGSAAPGRPARARRPAPSKSRPASRRRPQRAGTSAFPWKLVLALGGAVGAVSVLVVVAVLVLGGGDQHAGVDDIPGGTAENSTPEQIDSTQVPSQDSGGSNRPVGLTPTETGDARSALGQASTNASDTPDRQAGAAAAPLPGGSPISPSQGNTSSPVDQDRQPPAETQGADALASDATNRPDGWNIFQDELSGLSVALPPEFDQVPHGKEAIVRKLQNTKDEGIALRFRHVVYRQHVALREGAGDFTAFDLSPQAHVHFCIPHVRIHKGLQAHPEPLTARVDARVPGWQSFTANAIERRRAEIPFGEAEVVSYRMPFGVTPVGSRAFTMVTKYLFLRDGFLYEVSLTTDLNRHEQYLPTLESIVTGLQWADNAPGAPDQASAAAAPADVPLRSLPDPRLPRKVILQLGGLAHGSLSFQVPADTEPTACTECWQSLQSALKRNFGALEFQPALGVSLSPQKEPLASFSATLRGQEDIAFLARSVLSTSLAHGTPDSFFAVFFADLDEASVHNARYAISLVPGTDWRKSFADPKTHQVHVNIPASDVVTISEIAAVLADAGLEATTDGTITTPQPNEETDPSGRSPAGP